MAEIALLGCPFDSNSSYLRGAAEAPPKIREAFTCYSSNMWTENGIDLDQKGLWMDAGDTATFEGIPERVSELLNAGHRVISLGGDHSVTFPLLQGYHRKYPKLHVLHFDAHPDLYHDFEGNPFSHASPFARVMESNLVQRLVQVGIRTLNKHQQEQATKFGVEVHEMKDWRDDMRFEFDAPVYVTIDLDGLDPASAPGVSHPEPGGLSTRQVVQVIQSLKGTIVGADIVELNPLRDPLGLTAMVSAKLIKELMGRMIAG